MKQQMENVLITNVTIGGIGAAVIHKLASRMSLEQSHVIFVRDADELEKVIYQDQYYIDNLLSYNNPIQYKGEVLGDVVISGITPRKEMLEYIIANSNTCIVCDDGGLNYMRDEPELERWFDRSNYIISEPMYGKIVRSTYTLWINNYRPRFANNLNCEILDVIDKFIDAVNDWETDIYKSTGNITSKLITALRYREYLYSHNVYAELIANNIAKHNCILQWDNIQSALDAIQAEKNRIADCIGNSRTYDKSGYKIAVIRHEISLPIADVSSEFFRDKYDFVIFINTKYDTINVRRSYNNDINMYMLSNLYNGKGKEDRSMFTMKIENDMTFIEQMLLAF